ncbi:hypothetical protein K7X08_038014 [Anisodus acutangulus]|uniref:Two-component response regulator n=1 Tax=Anisodus acutangulus TaxID=402998 RepID=A0A9Q1MY09_9SOLA|nr:hypothetical protein K7X08_038014 [Anisodus acutangulus]
MFEEENSQTVEGMNNSMTAPYYDMRKDVCVMLVEHDKKCVTQMVDLLKSYSYKVMTVGRASTAMKFLSKGKEKVDVMIVNVHLPDLDSFQLLSQAIALDIVSLFICDEHNELLANKALNDGAYLYLKNSLDETIVKYLWQFVLREKIQREKARKQLEGNGDKMNVGDDDGIGNNNIVEDSEKAGEKNIFNAEEQSNNIHEAENEVISNELYKLRRKRGRKITKEISEVESQSNAINETVRRKACTEWTVDLHAKFMKVVQQLGEGRCYPKEIRKVMNVPGLTRMQVSSHLQKCRSNNWRAPKEQKSCRQRSGKKFSSGYQQRSRSRKYGTMPHLQTNIPIQQQQRNPDQTQRDPEFLFPTLNTSNIFARGETSTLQQPDSSELQVQPHYLKIDNPFNNLFLSDQSNAGGGLGQQYGSLFEMLDLQGLQDPIIGSTNYRFGQTFNSGDHHTQNDNNLDLNAAHVTTYLGSATMSGTNMGNAIIDELGVVNANFKQYIGDPNMSDPSNIIATSHAGDTKGSDSTERKNCDAYFDYNNKDYLFQNLGPPSANLPNEHVRKFDQVYYDDQVSASI